MISLLLSLYIGQVPPMVPTPIPVPTPVPCPEGFEDRGGGCVPIFSPQPAAYRGSGR